MKGGVFIHDKERTCPTLKRVIISYSHSKCWVAWGGRKKWNLEDQPRRSSIHTTGFQKKKIKTGGKKWSKVHYIGILLDWWTRLEIESPLCAKHQQSPKFHHETSERQGFRVHIKAHRKERQAIHEGTRFIAACNNWTATAAAQRPWSNAYRILTENVFQPRTVSLDIYIINWMFE